MSMITRSNAESLIPEEVTREIFQHLPQASSVLQLARRLPNGTRGQMRLPVLSSLPLAYFINGGKTTEQSSDTSYKKVSKAEWDNKYVDYEEVAVIVPIPEAVLDDADYDIWTEIRPHISEAFGLAVDQAILYGTNKPGSWPSALVTAAAAAGNTIVEGTNTDLYLDMLGNNGLVALLENDGYMPTAYIGAMSMRGKLRGVVGSDKHPIFTKAASGEIQSRANYALDGSPIVFPTNGAVNAATSLLIAAQWDKVVWSLRQDMTFKVLDQAIIQDPDTGDIVYNLAQQDMVALRVVMRLGWQVPNPVNRLNSNAATRYPAAVLTPAVGT
jgi:HK97 family phage major capsid protein